ncbi:ATP-binding protein [Halomonas campaniensis]|uniref:HAMP domain-containing sensor histidine kinase n=1 Tax=Halomonas campaniensis TaxID=213554 RepID=UPI0039707FCB
MTLSGNWSIKAQVFVAPGIIILLMLTTILIFDQVLRRQQATFLEVVHGPLARATNSATQLLLGVSEVQADVLRYAQRRERLPEDDLVLVELRRSILHRYARIEATFEALRQDAEGTGETDVIANIQDFLTIHRAVSERLIGGPSIDSVAMSSLMAHYQQLQSYITELTERSLASAQHTVDQAERHVGRLAAMLMAGSAIIILFSVLITLYIGRAISLPIARLIGIMTSVAEGRPVVEVPGQWRRDEIGEMARAVGVFDRVTRELRRREVLLEEARHTAEQANVAKSVFLANVSHELRTPLTSILGFTRIIQRRLERYVWPRVDTRAPRVGEAMAQVCDNIEIILTEGVRLTTLINNLLDLEKIEAGKMCWRLEAVEPRTLMALAADATAALHAREGLHFEMALPETLPRVRADRDRVVQVLINLISNAVKFTPHGRIRCSAADLGDGRVELAVSDTGRGIAPEDLQRIFDKFQQVGDTLTEKPTGTGLGLAICREIVTHLGGEMRVQSEPGKGSRFAFTLPVAESGPIPEMKESP